MTLREIRTCRFGGYHKEDVLVYLSEITRKAEERESRLTRQLEFASTMLGEQEIEKLKLRAELEDLKARCR